jgi:FkbM family methyltransferase
MLGRAIDVVFGALGYRVIREELLREMQGTIAWDRLATLPIKPRTVIDVGVADGTPELYKAFPDAYLVLVEPVQEFFPGIDQLLARRPGVHLPVALGATEAEMTMRVEVSDGAKSSFLPRTKLTATGRNGMERRIRVQPLDEAVRSLQLESPILLKIDVEGFELNVLRGAQDTLRKIDMLVLETSVAQRFEGAARFADVVGFLEAQGFELCDIVHIARDRRVGVRHADLVFSPVRH